MRFEDVEVIDKVAVEGVKEGRGRKRLTFNCFDLVVSAHNLLALNSSRVAQRNV